MLGVWHSHKAHLCLCVALCPSWAQQIHALNMLWILLLVSGLSVSAVLTAFMVHGFQKAWNISPNKSLIPHQFLEGLMMAASQVSEIIKSYGSVNTQRVIVHHLHRLVPGVTGFHSIKWDMQSGVTLSTCCWQYFSWPCASDVLQALNETLLLFII